MTGLTGGRAAADGGNVELAEIDGPVVYLRLKGACGSCPSSLTTMTMGIKRRLQEKIPVRAPAAARRSPPPARADLSMSKRSTSGSAPSGWGAASAKRQLCRLARSAGARGAAQGDPAGAARARRRSWRSSS